MGFSIDSGVNKGNYVVERTLDTVTLYKNDQNLTELTKTETEKKLQKLINLTKEEYFNFTHLSQSSTGNFLSKTASEKLAAIKDFVFGEEILKIKNNISELLKNKKDSLQRAKLELSKAEGSKISLQSIYDSLDSDIVVDNETINKNKQLLQDKQQKLNEKQKLERQENSLSIQFKQIQSQARKLKQDLASAKESVCPLCKQHLQDDELLKKLIQDAKNLKQNGLTIKQDLVNVTEELQHYLDVTQNEVQQLSRLVVSQEKQNSQQENKQNIEKEMLNYDKLRAKYQQEIDVLNEDIRQITELQKYFNTVFVEQIQQSFLKEIENYLNLYCYDVFNESFKLHFSNNSLDLSVGEHSYAYFSGGERQRIDLLFVFAIKTALANFTDKCTNLLILDESLSGSDHIAYENTIDMLSELSETSNIITLLVSHREMSNTVQPKIVIIRGQKKTKINVQE